MGAVGGTGAVVSPTVYRRNAGPSRPGMLTAWKPSHGPQKSMITAPSETRKATGMSPWAGGLSGSGLAAGVLAPEPLRVPASPERPRKASPAVTAITPSAVELLSRSLLFIVSPLRPRVACLTVAVAYDEVPDESRRPAPPETRPFAPGFGAASAPAGLGPMGAGGRRLVDGGWSASDTGPAGSRTRP